MPNKMEFFSNPDYASYLIEYRGDFLKDMKKIDYAYGFIINESYATLIIKIEDLDRIQKDVKSILFIDFRYKYVLQEVAPNFCSNINGVTSNPYLDLTGKDIIVGIVDTGIDYLNKAFINDDNTTRILSIWDQGMIKSATDNFELGEQYTKEDINKALDAFKAGKDPYEIVPHKDEYGHGTKAAGIIGARKYYEHFSGVAPECEFVVVKLRESTNYQKELKMSGITGVPVYNTSEIVNGIHYIVEFAKKINKIVIIYIGLGTTEHSHAGNSLLSRFINKISDVTGTMIVSTVGNEGDKEGHVSGNILNKGESETFELKVPRIIYKLRFGIWIQSSNKMSLTIISPSGESSRLIKVKINKKETIKFVNEDTSVLVEYYIPENITGNEVINLTFTSIKPGIWKFTLTAEVVISGRYDAWLPPSQTLPVGTKFLKSDSNNTLLVPSTCKGNIAVGYYDSINNTLLAASGKGYSLDNLVKPEVIAPGINIYTTKPGGGETLMSGGSAATAIVAGACALLLEWSVSTETYKTRYLTVVKSIVIAGAQREKNIIYPNRDQGYGKFDFLGIFNILNGTIKSGNTYRSYNVGSLFVNVPRAMLED